MQVTITVDCTPAEARQVMGLPDVQKMQEDWLKSMEAKIMAEADKLSPEAMLNSWMSGASANMEMLSGLMGAFTQGGGKKK